MTEKNERPSGLAGALTGTCGNTSSFESNYTVAACVGKPPADGTARIAELILPPVGESRLAANQRHDELAALRREAASAFGAKRDWRLSDRGFGPRTLAKGMLWTCESGRRCREWNFPSCFVDHPNYFRWPGGRAAAVVGHNYDMPLEIEGWAAENGLAIAVLAKAQSWYWPDVTTPVVFTRAANVIAGPWKARP